MPLARTRLRTTQPTSPAPIAASSRHRLRGRLLWALILLAFAGAFLRASQRPPAAPFVSQVWSAVTPAIAPDSKPASHTGSSARFDSGFLPNPNATQSHASSLVALPGGRVRAFWIDGEEGKRDSVVSSSVFDPATLAWSAPRRVTDANSTAPDVMRHVRKIGNMVAHRGDDGTLWLFYVTVSIGGWGGSSISWRTSSDDGERWSAAQRLITSPFLNFSTLVRNAPIAYADGTIGLPVYHEFLNMFSELLRIDRNGTILDRQRLSDRFITLQPQVLVQGPDQALVLMRNGGSTLPRKVLSSQISSIDRGSAIAVESSLANPGAPVSGVVLPEGRLLIALNSGELRRRVLALSTSNDAGKSWRTVHVLENQLGESFARVEPTLFESGLIASAQAGGASSEEAAKMAKFAAAVRCSGTCDFEFSYPFLIRTSDGDFLVVYTWNRAYVRWARFNQAWLDERIAAGGPTTP